MYLIQTILALTVTLGILVTVHEFGHFWVARRLGVRVLRFSVGFGRALFSWRDRQGTEYVIAAIPLGGYVKMLDEREGPVPQDQLDLTFNRKSPLRRIAIALAGPIANFIFAIAAYWLLSVVGFTTIAPVVGDVREGSFAERLGLTPGMEIVQADGDAVSSWRQLTVVLLNRVAEPGALALVTEKDGLRQEHQIDTAAWRLDGDLADPVARFGITPKEPDLPAVIGQVQADTPAQAAGLMAGDQILAIDEQPVSHWIELVEKVRAAANKTLQLKVARADRLLTVTLTPVEHTLGDGRVVGFIGASAQAFAWPESMLRHTRLNVLAAVPEALHRTWSDTTMTLGALQKMLAGYLSVSNVSGPITIARIAGASATSGFESFVRFLAYLSVSLGVLNLLPIPVLDGGHVVYYSIEALRGKALSETVQNVGLRLGMALILSLMILALYNDVMRL